MSVVSLKSRLTSDADTFQAAEKSATSLILAKTQGADQSTVVLSSNGLEIELRVGQRWAPTMGGDQPRFFATGDQPIKVPARGSVIVETLEYIAVPNNLLGVVFPKGSLFRETGLHPLTAKVDPTWRGCLRLLIQNAGAKPVVIRRGQPIATMSFFAMETTLSASLNFPDGELPVVRKSRVKSIGSFVQHPLVLALLTSALAATLGALITVWSTRH